MDDDNDNATPHSAASPTNNEESFDDFLSRELLKLSLQDRNAINEEIHGVRCLALLETPLLLETGLKEFEEALQRIPLSKKAAYELCRKRCLADSEYRTYAIHDDEFRLRFLRCELFDATKAATRYSNYLDFVHEMWGPIALQRPIRMSDFTTSEMKFFRKGYFQILPFRDQSGRRVFVVLGGMIIENNAVDNIARVSTVRNGMAFVEVKIECFVIFIERERERNQKAERADARISNCSLMALLLRSPRIVCFLWTQITFFRNISKANSLVSCYLFLIFFFFAISGQNSILFV